MIKTFRENQNLADMRETGVQNTRPKNVENKQIDVPIQKRPMKNKS